MKVTIKYTISVRKEIEMDCKDYCYLHADTNYKNFFPKNSNNRELYPSTIEDENELNDFFLYKRG